MEELQAIAGEAAEGQTCKPGECCYTRGAALKVANNSARRVEAAKVLTHPPNYSIPAHLQGGRQLLGLPSKEPGEGIFLIKT